MLKIHRWTGGWVFSRIQELFSFQQDVAATKKNPMCWLRRAEAEQNMTGNLVPLNTPTTHGNSWRFSSLEIWVITVITPENQGSTCFFLGTLYESSHAEMKVIVALPVGSKIHDVDLGIFSQLPTFKSSILWVGLPSPLWKFTARIDAFTTSNFASIPWRISWWYAVEIPVFTLGFFRTIPKVVGLGISGCHQQYHLEVRKVQSSKFMGFHWGFSLNRLRMWRCVA